MKTLLKITDVLTKILTALACAYFVYIVFACVMQVFSRYILNSSFGWTEETARLAFASMGMLGAPVALRKGMHVNVDILESKLHGNALRAQKFINLLFLFVIFIILFVEGIVLFKGSMGSYSPAVKVPMTMVYYTIPVSALASIWILFVETLEVWSNKKGKEA